MKTLLLVLLTSLSLLQATSAVAQAYPAKPVRLVVPYPPGGGNDTLARLFGQKLGDRLGQQFVVDNRPGAGATLGTDVVAKSAPDGYTILLSSIATHALSPNLYAKVPYDPVRDFTPIVLLAVAPTVAVVNKDLPVKSLGELIALAKSRPGKLTYASGGNGTPPHIAGELFKSLAGIDLLHIPYKGGGPALADVMGGQVDAMFDTAASCMPHVKSGRLKALAIGRISRSPDFPDLPTFAEAGLPGYEMNAWYSMHAPAGTPREIIDRLNAELNAILKLPDVQERLKALGIDAGGGTPDELAAYVRAENAKYGRLIRDAGIRIE
jgi:tripartite-type tricarboxylate transporter receptor subunit TctC